MYFTGAENVPAEFCVSRISEGSTVATSVETGPAVVTRTHLFEPRPNPFNPTTSIRFAIPEASRVRLAVYDAAGRLVSILADGSFPVGEFERIGDGRDQAGRAAPSGVYFARLQADRRADTKKLVLVR
ncbi:MAG: T9SS type A sorting domain-containing protein [Candidatus Eisenbacteria bacterium]